MSTETATAQPTTNAPATAQSAQPKAGSHELLAKFAAEAQASIVAAEASTEPAAAGDAGADGGQAQARKPATQAPERGADGKFKPAAKTTDTKTSPATGSGDAPAAPSSDGGQEGTADSGGRSVPDSIARVRRLFADGKLEEAEAGLRKLGFDPDAIFKGSHSWAAVRAEGKRSAEKLTATKRQLDQEIAQAQQVFRPLAEAKRLFDAGDWGAAIQAMTGVAPEEATRRILRGKLEQRSPDPQVKALQDEIRALREERQRDAAERQQREQESARTAGEAKAREWLDGQFAEIRSSADERITRVANRPAFQDAVKAVFRRHLDPTGNSVDISAEEAAAEAYDYLYGDDGEPAPVAASTGSKRDRSAQPARLPARAATPVRKTNLNSREAAEATAPVKFKPGSQELLAHFAQQAETLRAQELASAA